MPIFFWGYWTFSHAAPAERLSTVSSPFHGFHHLGKIYFRVYAKNQILFTILWLTKDVNIIIIDYLTMRILINPLHTWVVNVWRTLTWSEYDLFWIPLLRLKDSDGIDNAVALLGGWSSEGLTGTSQLPIEKFMIGAECSFLFLDELFIKTSSTLTLSGVFSPEIEIQIIHTFAS